ncbi:FISUMP domain-containing protein [Aquirufa sp. ROCK2-A2]
MKKCLLLTFFVFIGILSCTNRDGEIIDLINSVKKQNDDLKAQITALKKTTDSALVAILKVNSSQIATDKKIDLIQTDLKALLAQIASLNIQMSSLNADIGSLLAKIDALQVKCAELVAQISNLNSSNNGYLSDIDGNKYNAVKIGNQVWMAENLRVSRYQNGDLINYVNINDNVNQWDKLTNGSWCYYNNDATYDSTYGKLYNWNAVMDSRGLAPKGWHIPTEEEWNELITFLGGSNIAGGKLKSTGTKEEGTGQWDSPNFGATNSSGFNALPHGYIYNRTAGLGNSVFFWSTTEYELDKAHAKILDYASEKVTIGNDKAWSKKYGFSVRCIKN